DRRPGRLKLLEFAAEENVRGLQVTTVGAEGAVWVEEFVDLIDHLCLVGVAGEGHDQVVEGAPHIEGTGEGLPGRPHHTETPVVGEHGGGTDLVDVLRGEGDP